MRCLVVFLCCFIIVSGLRGQPFDKWIFSRNIVKAFFNPRSSGLGYSRSTIFSPFSMEVSLLTLAHGADHQTLQELLKFVGYDKLQSSKPPLRRGYVRNLIDTFDRETDEDFKLKFSNRLYVDTRHPINISYVYEIKDLYKADVVGANFDDRSNALATINNWLKMETAGKLSDSLTAAHINEGVSLLPVSNLYFEGKWPDRFIEKKGFFKKEDGHKSVRTFFTGVRNTGYEENDYLQAQVLSLGFVRRGSLKIVMNIFLPHSSRGFGKMLEKLSKKPDSLWKCPLEQNVVNVIIPRFELTKKATEFMWNPVLLANETLLNYFFAPRRDLDLNKIFPGAVLAGIHTRAYISVSGDGINTGPGTSVSESSGGSPNSVVPEVQFTADHPFAFSVLTEPTGDLLYVGTFKG